MENKKARLHDFVRDSLANRVDTHSVDREFKFRIDDQLMMPVASWLLPNFRRIIYEFKILFLKLIKL